MADEDDYMSDAVLAQCADVRSSLLSAKAARERKIEAEQRVSNDKHRQKPRRAIEIENRDKGLGTALNADNKGFSLLAKMGYKPGSAIGKRGTGLLEPIGVVVKDNRTGLGHEAQVRQRQEQRSQMLEAVRAKRRRQQEEDEMDFRVRQRQQQAERRIMADLTESQAVCEQLDREQGVESPSQDYYWASKVTEAKKASENEVDTSDTGSRLSDNTGDTDSDTSDSTVDDTTAEEKLVNITSYLRSTHRYCLWCGIKFNDDLDLSSTCPGNTSEAHE